MLVEMVMEIETGTLDTTLFTSVMECVKLGIGILVSQREDRSRRWKRWKEREIKPWEKPQ